MKLISELGQVNVIQIPRCVTSEPDTKELVYELEAFGDASSSGGLLGIQIPNQYSSPIDCIKNWCCPTKEANHFEVGALSCVNTDKVDSTDQENTGTVPRCQSCPLLDRLEKFSILD